MHCQPNLINCFLKTSVWAAKVWREWVLIEQQAVLEREWVLRVAANDPWVLQSVRNDVWYYLILKLAQLIRRGKRIGQAAWSFQPRQVRDLHYGYVWSHGGKEQATEFPTSGSVADIMAAGSEWWPVIWVDVVGVRLPVYCPGLAWMNARPWYAHRTRLWEVPTPSAINEEEFDLDGQIIDVDYYGDV